MVESSLGAEPQRVLQRWTWRWTMLRAAVLLLQACWVAVPASAETRVALVIGNSAYESKRLKNARNDAELMARTLSEAEFDVIPVFDGDMNRLQAAVAEFGRKLAAPGTVALFYYAGHGVQAGGENYLIPLAAGIANLADVATKSLALGDVLAAMAKSQSRLNIVILDACRDNPFAAASGPAEGGLAAAVAPAGTIIGYATAPGQIARDGAGNNSPYTAALAASIPQPGRTLEEIFRSTRRRVIDETAGKQVPWEHSSLIGEFYFKPKTALPESSERRTGPMPDGDQRLAELDAWDLIKVSKDPAAFKAHIERFPDGIFSELAAVRLAKLETMQAQPAWSWIITGDLGREIALAAAERAFEKAVLLDGEASASEDLKTAATLYQEAAAQNLPQAMYALGRAYDKGRGVPRDLVKAAHWYERAVDANHAGAMASLGTMYEFGEGTTNNLAIALRLYRQAADAGDPNGATNLAYLYAQGKGVARNPGEARRLYTRAADKGLPRAMFNLALMLVSGEGGKTDLAQALRLLQTAADLGHSGACQELAYLYDEGRGVARNPKLAAAHYIKALRATHRAGQKVEVFSKAWTFATRRELQRQLASQGLYKGGIHGFFNEATRKALVLAARG